MLNLGFEAFATFIVIVAPIAIVLFLILVVVAYPWLLLVPLGIWYLVTKYGSDEVPRTGETHESQTDEQAQLEPERR